MRNIFIFLLISAVLPACANNSDTIAQQEKMAAALKFNCHRVLPSGARLIPDNFCQCFSDKAKQTLTYEELREVSSLFQTSADWRGLERGYAQLGDTVTYQIIGFAEACDGRNTQ